jgi:arylsulfatase A-like enzyme
MRALSLLLPLVLVLLPTSALAEGRSPPNFVILYADDAGYGDLGCYGHPTIRTPELDKMAREGMRFTQFYVAAPVCTPSRAALLTGRLPIRSGLTVVLSPRSKGGILDNEITLAQALKTKHYATACIGKWHLGHLEPYRPLRHGFDHYYGLLYSNDMKPLALYQDNRDIEEPVHQETLTKRYTEEALRFIEECRQAARPFLLYLAYTMPHVPLAVSERFAGHSRRGLYGDVLLEIDWSAGQILKTLRDARLAENTLVFFSSDNGPWLSKKEAGGSAGLLREGKGSTWEGGIREPFIAWWPGTIRPGVVSLEVATTMDFFATGLSLAGVPLPDDRTIDGRDLLPVLRGQSSRPTVPLFFYIDTDLTAVRKGPWKMHLQTQSEFDYKHRKTHKPPLLYNVEEDPSESDEVARQHPDVIADLMREIEQHRKTLKPGKLQR